MKLYQKLYCCPLPLEGMPPNPLKGEILNIYKNKVPFRGFRGKSPSGDLGASFLRGI
jgi:hypothetical protein